MNIECINCSKIFEVNSDLIPDAGRNLQCGSCNHIWFFNKKEYLKIQEKNIEIKEISPSIIDNFETPQFEDSKNDKNEIKIKKIKKELPKKVKNKTNLRLSHLLSFVIVFIISFVAFIILIDTFKKPLFDYFPNLELIFYNLFETIKDISLFIEDLF